MVATVTTGVGVSDNVTVDEGAKFIVCGEAAAG